MWLIHHLLTACGLPRLANSRVSWLKTFNTKLSFLNHNIIIVTLMTVYNSVIILCVCLLSWLSVHKYMEVTMEAYSTGYYGNVRLEVKDVRWDWHMIWWNMAGWNLVVVTLDIEYWGTKATEDGVYPKKDIWLIRRRTENCLRYWNDYSTSPVQLVMNCTWINLNQESCLNEQVIGYYICNC